MDNVSVWFTLSPLSFESCCVVELYQSVQLHAFCVVVLKCLSDDLFHVFVLPLAHTRKGMYSVLKWVQNGFEKDVDTCGDPDLQFRWRPPVPRKKKVQTQPKKQVSILASFVNSTASKKKANGAKTSATATGTEAQTPLQPKPDHPWVTKRHEKAKKSVVQIEIKKLVNGTLKHVATICVMDSYTVFNLHRVIVQVRRLFFFAHTCCNTPRTFHKLLFGCHYITDPQSDLSWSRSCGFRIIWVGVVSLSLFPSYCWLSVCLYLAQKHS